MEPDTSRITVVKQAKLAAASTIHIAPRKGLERLMPSVAGSGSLVMGDSLLPDQGAYQPRFGMAALRRVGWQNII
jgi:hypothetical protein